MVAKVKHLLNRDGRYFTRIVITKELRPFLNNKSDLREPLGAVAAQRQIASETGEASGQEKFASSTSIKNHIWRGRF